MKLFLVALLMLGVTTIPATSQEQPVRTVQGDTVSVSAQGHFDSEPDTALMQFTISTSEKSAKAAYERAARSVDQVREMLRSTGIDLSAARFGFFSLSPVYDYKGGGKRKIVQYVVNATVQLRFKQFDKVGPILDQLAALDITGDQTLNYIVENTEASKAKAVQDAMNRARSEAEMVARAGSRTLGGLVWAAVDTQERVRTVYDRSELAEFGGGTFSRTVKAPPAPPSQGFAPGGVIITAQVHALFALK